MIEFKIPNGSHLKIEILILDFNGTIACNGKLIKGIKQRLNILAKKFKIFVLTADTFGTVRNMFDDMEVELVIAKSEKEKSDFVKKLGSGKVVAIGNGRIDCLMLKESVVGMTVIGDEGASVRSLLSSNLVVKDIKNALDLLIWPKKLISLLRL